MPNLEQIKRELKKYNFAYEENVLPVHTNGHYFLYGFYEKGIAIFALRSTTCRSSCKERMYF